MELFRMLYERMVVARRLLFLAALSAIVASCGDDEAATNSNISIASSTTVATIPTIPTTTIDVSPATSLETSSSVAPEPDEATKPDCSESCNIVQEGDSITEGLGPLVCDVVKTDACINSGASGQRVDQMIETAKTDVDNIVGEGENDVLILWAGTNDLWRKHHSPDPEENATATYENIKTYIEARRESGWDYIFIVTHPPMDPAKVTGVEKLNELITENTANADEIIALASEPKLSDPFDEQLRSADGVHYKPAGNDLVATEYFILAIQSLKG